MNSLEQIYAIVSIVIGALVFFSVRSSKKEKNSRLGKNKDDGQDSPDQG